MLRSALNFFSQKALQKSSTEEKPLLKTQPKPEANDDLAKQIAQDIKAYLALRPVAAKQLSLWEPKKTPEQLLSDFKIKNQRYLQKKQAFKHHENKHSTEYENLRKEYLEATDSAYAAINLWLAQLDKVPEEYPLSVASLSMK